MLGGDHDGVGCLICRSPEGQAHQTANARGHPSSRNGGPTHGAGDSAGGRGEPDAALGLMLILSLGDLHFRPHFFDFVAAQAGRYDAICLAGDFLDMHPLAKLDVTQQADRVLDWFQGLRTERTRFFAVTGNHDWWPGDDPGAEGRWLQRARRTGIAVDGDVTAFGGWRFVCWPWSGAVEAVGSLPTVLVAHAPPERTAVAQRKGWDGGGDYAVRLAAENLPQGIVLSGHVHRPDHYLDYVRITPCFNAGCDLTAPIPLHLVIDTEERLVSRIGPEGVTGFFRY